MDPSTMNKNFFHINKFGEKVLVLGSLNNAKYISTALIKFTQDENLKILKKEIKGELISVKELTPDKKMLQTFTPPLLEVKKYLTQKIAEIDKTISSLDSLFGSSAFVDLIHKIQLDITKADISITAPLSLTAKIKKGIIYRRDLFALYQYENLLYTMSLTGKEIKDFLEYSYALWFNKMKNENDHLLLFTKDSSGNILWSDRYNAPLLKTRYYMYDSAAGIDYTVDVSKPQGNRINIKSFTSGKKFILTETYTVAINSYRGNGGGGHLLRGAKINEDMLKKRIISTTSKDLRSHLMEWLYEKKKISPEPLNNWKVIPESWWKKGQEKDSKIFFK